MADAASELEIAIAEAGALLAQADKYQASSAPAAVRLRREALAVGDRARQAHRRESLGAAAAGLLGEVLALTARLRSWLATVRGADDYLAAVAALTAGDRRRLVEHLPRVFARLEVVERPPDLHHVVPWFRRGRPLPAEEVAAAVAELKSGGIEGDGDELAPGRDPSLPAVVLTPERPPDEPVVLRLHAAGLPAPIVRLTDDADHLVHAVRLVAPSTVLVPAVVGDEVLEAMPVDFPRWRRRLVAALAAHHIEVVTH
jgi:hypothetical protein